MSEVSADARPATRSFEASDIAFIAVFAALIAAASITPPIPIPASPVDITLQTLAISLTALVLGPWKGVAAVLLWLAVGTAGLPVFSGASGGVGTWLGVTAGYLLSFPISTLATGLISRRILRSGVSKLTPLWLLLTLVVVRIVVILPIGVAGMARFSKVSFGEAFFWDLPFLPGDLVKSIVAVFVALAVFKAFPKLLHR